MKSRANDVLDIALGLCKDIRVAYPTYVGVAKDETKLSRMSQTRGLAFFTLDLPHLDSLLLQGLECGRILPSGPMSCMVSKRVRVPRFLSGLWLRVFDIKGVLKEDVDTTAVAFLRQIFCLGKKLSAMCTSARLEKALQEYEDVERGLREPSHDWFSEELRPSNGFHRVHFCDVLDAPLPLFGEEPEFGSGSIGRRLLARCQQVADIVAAALGPFDPTVYSDGRIAKGSGSGFRHGPGAVAERSGRYFDKFQFTNWTRKLATVFPPEEFAVANPSFGVDHLINHEVPSRLVAVPKTAKTMRLIAAEPSEHQWCQQSILAYLVERLSALFGTDFICFKQQSLSQDMARRGSLDGNLATVDLSSASDRLSCHNIERAFRRNPTLLGALHAVRTRWLKDSVGSQVRYYRLKKFAAQGTAVTFPVQSIFFLCIALGCSIDGPITMEAIKRMSKKVRVFGDDIIVPSHRYADVELVLHLLGLKVNVDKSFHKGLFREACGGDYYKGDDVTPVKPTCLTSDGTGSVQSIIDTANNLYLKGYWHASDRLIRQIDGRLRRQLSIVGLRSGITGLVSHTAQWWSPPDHMVRWNHHLQRHEVRTVLFVNRAGSTEYSGHSALHAFFTRGSKASISSGNIDVAYTRYREIANDDCFDSERTRTSFGSTVNELRRLRTQSLSRLINPVDSALGFAERPVLRKKHGWADLSLLYVG